jgi:hypothetical protein
MKRLVSIMMLLFVAGPGFAKTHKELFNVPCDALWSAVKDTLRNSAKYGIIGIDNAEMAASYNVGGTLTGKRVNSLVLNSSGSGCELQIQTAYSGIVNNDAGDFKKRVQESLDKLRANREKSTDAAPKLSGNALTNSDILSLKQAGLSDQLLVDKIRASPGKYTLETNDLVALKKAGIADAVISAMLEVSKRL